MNILPHSVAVPLALAAALIGPAQADEGTYTKIVTWTCAWGDCRPGPPTSPLVETAPGVFSGIGSFGQLYTVDLAGQVTLGLQLPAAYYAAMAAAFQASDGALWVPSTSNNQPTMNRIDASGRKSWPLPIVYTSQAVVQDTQGRLWGASQPVFGTGQIYTITLDGQVKVRAEFPQERSVVSMVAASDGHIYALTAPFAGSDPSWLLQLDTRSGVPRSIGSLPTSAAQLAEGPDGHFYGCASNSDTLFRLTKTGVYTALHHLAGGAEGASVTACSLLASDGHLYGMTYQQGAYGYGTIFRATLDGQITTVHAFTGADQGQHPSQYVARMAQGSDGALYGETTSAAANAPGYNTGATTYRLDLGLSRPAPRLLRASALRAAVGDTVLLTGSNLLGATGVSINGTAAPFEVRSAQYLVMTVPVGAHSGSVEVVTPAGHATSPFVLRIR